MIDVQGFTLSDSDRNLDVCGRGDYRLNTRGLQENQRLSDKIDSRQDNQLDRIRQSFGTPKLRQNALFRLMQGQRAIRTRSASARPSGFMTPGESEELTQQSPI
jgi:hypothetical protein